MADKTALETSYSPETDELTEEDSGPALSCRQSSCKFTTA